MRKILLKNDIDNKFKVNDRKCRLFEYLSTSFDGINAHFKKLEYFHRFFPPTAKFSLCELLYNCNKNQKCSRNKTFIFTASM